MGDVNLPHCKPHKQMDINELHALATKLPEQRGLSTYWIEGSMNP